MILISSFLISLSALYRLVVLPEPGGPGDQNDAVRQLDQLAELGVDVLVHAHAAQREVHPFLVEDTHHDAFAVQHGNDGQADVDFAARDFELDAAVLRHALLGDVEPRHDLQAADDRGLKAIDLRRHRLQLQHAVDAIANFDARRLATRCEYRSPGLRPLRERISFTSRTTEASWAISEASERSHSSSSSTSTPPSSSRCASRPSTVSAPTPKCVLISLASSARRSEHRASRSSPWPRSPHRARADRTDRRWPPPAHRLSRRPERPGADGSV